MIKLTNAVTDRTILFNPSYIVTVNGGDYPFGNTRIITTYVSEDYLVYETADEIYEMIKSDSGWSAEHLENTLLRIDSSY